MSLVFILLVILARPFSTIQNSAIAENTEATSDRDSMVEPVESVTDKPLRLLSPTFHALPNTIPDPAPVIQILANPKFVSIETLENQSTAATVAALTRLLDDPDAVTRIDA